MAANVNAAEIRDCLEQGWGIIGRVYCGDVDDDDHQELLMEQMLDILQRISDVTGVVVDLPPLTEYENPDVDDDGDEYGDGWDDEIGFDD